MSCEPSYRDWLRLALVTVSATLVCGLLPGQAFFVPMFAEWGVYSSICKVPPGNSTTATAGTSTNVSGSMPINLVVTTNYKTSCAESQIALAGVFSVLGVVASFGSLPAGFLFDRFGGRRVSVIGAISSFFGLLLLELPLVGAMHNQDAYTRNIFPVALALTDVGNLFSQFTMLTLVYHFPKHQVFVGSLIVATNQICAILPNMFSFVQKQMGISLPWVFAVYAIVVLISAFLLCIFVPSQEEYLNQGEKVLGETRENNVSTNFWYQIRSVCKLFCSHCLLHAFFCVAMCMIFLSVTTYENNLGLYLKLMWNNERKADDFASLATILTATFGTVAVVVLSRVADWLGGRKAIYVLSLAGILSLVLMTIFVTGHEYVSQLICLLATVLLLCLVVPMSMFYCVLHSPAALLGSFNGVLWTFVSGFSLLITIPLYRFLGMDKTYEQLGMHFLAIFVTAVFAFAGWLVHMRIVGVPEISTMHDDMEVRLRNRAP